MTIPSSIVPCPSRAVLVTGGTGYLGQSLVAALVQRGHRVRLLVRSGSERKVATGAEIVVGDALDAAHVGAALAGRDTLVHLVGVPKPSPAKARQFRVIDLASVRAAVGAAAAAVNPPHVVYLSVAQPAPVMRAYVAVRTEGEALIRAGGLNATFVRPWYVLGPGHRWPYGLVPLYAVLRLIPSTRDSAIRLGLVTLKQMTCALVRAVEHPTIGINVAAVPDIRAAAKSFRSGVLRVPTESHP